MHWFTAFVLYVLIWWVVLFAILPVGAAPVTDAADSPGGWRGAPAHPHLLRKLLATTAVSAALWAIAMGVITSGWLSFRSGWLASPRD